MKYLILFVSLVIVVVNSAKLPNYLRKCKIGSDTLKCVVENGNNVIKKIIHDGDPKFNLQHLNPVHVKHIELQATPQLTVALDEVDMMGFEDMEFSSGSIDKNGIKFSAKMKHMAITGKYDINGKILILPIKGTGNCNITVVDFDAHYSANFTTEERKGKKYLKIENADTDLKLENIQHVYLQFENLFNGDERLGTEMNKFLNENWKEAYGEMHTAIEQAASYSIINHFISGYLHYVPINELFDE